MQVPLPVPTVVSVMLAIEVQEGELSSMSRPATSLLWAHHVTPHVDILRLRHQHGEVEALQMI
jgi:hypothetical protein